MVARETCTLITLSIAYKSFGDLTHLAERQDKASSETRLTETRRRTTPARPRDIVCARRVETVSAKQYVRLLTTVSHLTRMTLSYACISKRVYEPVSITGSLRWFALSRVLTDELRGSIPLQATNIRRVGALVRAVRRPLRTALTFVLWSGSSVG